MVSFFQVEKEIKEKKGRRQRQDEGKNKGNQRGNTRDKDKTKQRHDKQKGGSVPISLGSVGFRCKGAKGVRSKLRVRG